MSYIPVLANASLQNPYQSFEKTIPVNGRETIFFAHRFFRVLSISGSMAVRWGGSPQAAIIGQGVAIELDEAFDRVEIINTGAGTLTVTVALAMGKVYDDRFTTTATLNTMEVKAATLTNTTDVTLVAAAAAVTLLAANTSRRAAIITNTSTTNSVRIGNSPGAATGAYLAPGASITLEGTFEIKGYSAAGATVSLLEVLD